MKRFLLPIALLSVYLSSCGPAAEDRQRMDYVARRNSDSIGKWLDSALNDPNKELGLPPAVAPNPLAADTTKK